MRVVVGAALYVAFAFLAGTILNEHLRRRFSLPPILSMILSQIIALLCAWGLLMLLFRL